MDISAWSSKFIKISNKLLSQFSGELRLRLPERFDAIGENLLSLYRITKMLGNGESQEIFLQVLLARLFTSCFNSDHDYFTLYPIFPKDIWQYYERKANKKIQYRSLKGVYNLDLIETWILEGYACKNICEASKGDIVIDGGAHTGNTAIYFSEKVGLEGHVHAFEPSPTTFSYLEQNISDVGLPNISNVHAALGEFVGQVTFPDSLCPGASLNGKFYGVENVSVPQTTIDSYCSSHNIIPTFIKLDVEGAEYQTLNGAKESIQKYNPKMVISLYHRDNDFVEIPHLLLDINPYYEFYVKHSSNNLCETVLFCKPTDYKNEIPNSTNEEEEYISALKESLLSFRKYIEKT